MRYVFAIALIVLGHVTPVKAEFVGNLVLTPADCKQAGQCVLGESFGFIDKFNVGWEADAGDVTDGASIPRWAQFFVGVPFDDGFLPAAVLHDHYSKSVRPVMRWLETQRMFQEALLANGVSEDIAAILYAGVLIGSGKWINRMEGKPCPTLSNCINAARDGELTLIRQAPSFDAPEHAASMQRMTARIQSEGITDIAAIEDLARSERPDDIYLNNPSGIIRSVVSDGATRMLSSEY